MSDAVEEFIEHHGIKGMRWGVHRSAKETKARAERQKIANNRRHLSDEELKKHIDRISNEKKLKTLTEEDLTPGRAVAKKIVSESGQKVAKTVLTGAALYGIKLAVTRKFDPVEAASMLTKRGK